MFKPLVLFLFTLLPFLVQAQDVSYTLAAQHHGTTSAPSPLQNNGCDNNTGSPVTCTFSSAVTAGQNIFVGVGVNIASSTFTITDNCNTGGSSDTFTLDKGPTGSAGTGELLHATIGANTSICTVKFVYTGSTGIPIGTVTIATFSGSGTLDTSATFNSQTSPGTGTNAITSNAASTSHKDLCYGWTMDLSASGGTISAGTNIGWTLGVATPGSASAGDEYFAQSSSGSITATFTTTYSFTTSLTGISCFEP